MNVSLTPELEKLVADKVAAGLYASASEVIRDALRLLEERDMLRQAKLEAMRKGVQKGFDELDRGEGVPTEQVFEELRKKQRQRRGSAA